MVLFKNLLTVLIKSHDLKSLLNSGIFSPSFLDFWCESRKVTAHKLKN